LAVLPKIGGAVGLVRLMVIALPPQFAEFAWQVALVIAVLTMTIGNICALWQNNLRRMMGYSSIAHAGYMLIGLTVALAMQSLAGQDVRLNYGGIAAMLFYLIVYAFGSLGTFAVLAHLSTESREFNTVDELAGLNKAHPTAAALMAVFMFSLAGIPPLAGFWGKLTLFTSAVNLSSETATENSQLSTWLLVLAVAGALNAAIAATYYLRVVGAMYFRSATGAPVERGGVGGLGAAAICCVMIVLLGVAPRFMLASALQAESSALAWPAATAPQLAEQAAPVAPLANR
jgi:NADH-quinone oxidoreductase subunit N